MAPCWSMGHQKKASIDVSFLPTVAAPSSSSRGPSSLFQYPFSSYSWGGPSFVFGVSCWKKAYQPPRILLALPLSRHSSGRAFSYQDVSNCVSICWCFSNHCVVDICRMHFGYIPGRGTTDAIFIMWQLQNKHCVKERNLHLVFVEVEKVIDSVSLEVLWWTKRYSVVTQWLVSPIQALYTNVKSGVCNNNSFPNTFDVQMGGY